MAARDITGERFGRLTAIRPTGQSTKYKQAIWECLCDCGETVFVSRKSLVQGNTRSCGCIKQRNLTGERFGKLVAMRPTDQRRDGRVVWECQCDCGKVTFVIARCLINGDTKSCGCKRTQGKDISGQRFGKLTAIRLTDDRRRGRKLWECKCDCGNTVYQTVGSLNGGNVKSCGCTNWNIVDITGQKFSRLTALRPLDKSRDGATVWECRCDCGNISYVTGTNLRRGITKSCGCLRDEVRRNNFKTTRTTNYIAGTRTNQLCQQPGEANKSGIVGVGYNPSRDQWLAHITFRGITYHLGFYEDKEDAIAVREKAEAELHTRFLELYEQGMITKDSTELVDSEIKFDYMKILGRHKCEEPSTRRQGYKTKKETTSQYVGVSRGNSRWRALIYYKRKSYHLGYFESEEMAARAYDKAALELYGERARLNFPINV